MKSSELGYHLPVAEDLFWVCMRLLFRSQEKFSRRQSTTIPFKLKFKILKSNFELQGIDITMTTGELFCLLGHNGAGKTTTISMMTGLITATGLI